MVKLKISKLFPKQATNKKVFKTSKLKVELNIPKGTKILAQQSPFFQKEYAKEKALLAWN